MSTQTSDPFTFDNMTRCQTPGCEWNVVLPRTRCRNHDGEQPWSYEYLSGAYGDLIATRGFDYERNGGCE